MLLSISQKNATYDEHLWLEVGKYIRYNLKWDRIDTVYHPPLSFYIQGLLFKAGAIFKSGNSLFWARASFLPVFILLGVYVYKWSAGISSPAVGILSLLYYSLSPNIIANARLITTDFLFTAMGFIAAYYLWKALTNTGYYDILLSGLFLGLALLSKYSSILLIFAFFCIIPCQSIFKGEETADISLRKRLFTLFAVLIIAVFILHIGYLLGITNKEFVKFIFRSHLFAAIKRLPIINNILSLLPYPFAAGIDYQGYLADKGKPVFLFGKKSINGWWYYYILALLIKLPIPSLLLLLFSPVYCYIHKKEKKSGSFPFLFIPPVFIFIYFSFFASNYSGLRFILFIFPFMHILFGHISGYIINSKNGIIKYIPAALILWQMISILMIHPDYLAYCNELIGGPENGYKYLSGSNIDWGQDIERAKLFYEKNKKDIKIDPPCSPAVGKYLINVNDLLDTIRLYDCHNWLGKFMPDDNISYTWLIFNITFDKIKRLSGSQSQDVIDYYMASALFHKGRYNKSSEYIQKAIKGNPHESTYYNLSGKISMKQGDYETALTQFYSSLEFGAGSVAALKNISEILEIKGDYREANNYYNRAIRHEIQTNYPFPIEIDSDYYKNLLVSSHSKSKYINNLAVSLWMEERGSEAASLLNGLIDDDPYFMESYLNLASMYTVEGNDSIARAVMQRYSHYVNDINARSVAIISYGKDRIILDDILVLFPFSDSRIIKMRELRMKRDR